MLNYNCTVDFENGTIICGEREFKILKLNIGEYKIGLKDTDELHGGKLDLAASVLFGDRGAEIFKQLVDEFPECVI